MLSTTTIIHRKKNRTRKRYRGRIL